MRNMPHRGSSTKGIARDPARPVRVLLACLAITQICCSKTPVDYSEDRGTELADVKSEWGTVLAWPAGRGSLIVADDSGLRSIDRATHVMQAIEDSAFVGWLSISADGNTIWYGSGDCVSGCTTSLFSASIDGSNRLHHVPDLHIESPVVTSADSLVACAEAGDSMTLYNAHTGARTFLANGIPMAFSPDGRQLLYSHNGAYAVMNLADRTSSAMSIGIGDGVPYIVRWDAGGIHIFYLRHSSLDYCIRDVATGTTTTLWKQGEFIDFSMPAGLLTARGFAWSADRRRVAFWGSKCLSKSFLGCNVGRLTVHVMDVATKRERTVAYALEAAIHDIALSPTGDSVAYGFGGRVYVAAVKLD